MFCVYFQFFSQCSRTVMRERQTDSQTEAETQRGEHAVVVRGQLCGVSPLHSPLYWDPGIELRPPALHDKGLPSDHLTGPMSHPFLLGTGNCRVPSLCLLRCWKHSPFFLNAKSLSQASALLWFLLSLRFPKAPKAPLSFLQHWPLLQSAP